MTNTHLRPLSLADCEDLRLLMNEAFAADTVPERYSAADMEDYLGDPHFNLEEDARVAVRDGAIVGYAKLFHRPSDEREVWAYLDGAVHPGHRREGIGRELAEWQITRGTALLNRASTSLPRRLRVEIHPQQVYKEQLFAGYGFEPVRWFEEMLRPLDEIPEPQPVGFEVLPWDEQRSEEIRAVNVAAFRDHWGSVPIDQQSWARLMKNAGVRLDLSFMAVAGGRVVGYSLSMHFAEEEQIHGRREGWIGSLGTANAWRGRGVATALIIRSCRAFREAGFTHAALGVDSDNPSGARGLYTRLGFQTDRSHQVFQKTI